MAKGRSIDEKLMMLNAVHADPTAAESAEILSRALLDKSNSVVAAAARIIADAELSEHAIALEKAFDRFMIRPDKTDKGCLAKTSIVNALYRCDVDAIDLYLQGIRHVQHEPVWGGKEDIVHQ